MQLLFAKRRIIVTLALNGKIMLDFNKLLLIRFPYSYGNFVRNNLMKSNLILPLSTNATMILCLANNNCVDRSHGRTTIFPTLNFFLRYVMWVNFCQVS